MVTRRKLSTLLLAPALQAQQPMPITLPDLPLEPALLREVTEESRRAVQQAGLLRELPLEGVAPAFVFLAR